MRKLAAIVLTLASLATTAAQDRIIKYRKKLLDKAAAKYQREYRRVTDLAIKKIRAIQQKHMRRGELDGALTCRNAIRQLENERARIVLEQMPVGKSGSPPPITLKLKNCEIANMGEGVKLYSNRKYKIVNLPKEFHRGYKFTRLAGGRRGSIVFIAERNCILYCARWEKEKPPTGWYNTGTFFRDTAKDRSKFAIYALRAQLDYKYILPQTDWAGTMLIWKP